MTKTLAIISSLLLCATESFSQTTIRFQRTGTAGTDVSVSVLKADGTTYLGANATFESTSTFKATTGSITSSILCPNVNGNSANFTEQILNININGLAEDFTFKGIDMDIHAMNGSNAYQVNSDGKQREWTVELKVNQNSYSKMENFDIAAGVGQSGNVHQNWTFEGDTYTTTNGTLTLQICINRGTNNVGCFFGLGDITLLSEGSETPEVNLHPLNKDAFYHVRWTNNTSLFMTAKADNKLQVENENVGQAQYWQFEPIEEKAHTYYVKNATSGKYIQTCNLSNSSQSRPLMGEQPVEYYVYPGEGAMKGSYRFTSTDCPDYDNSSASPHGLNKDGAGSNVIVWNAAESNGGSWWTLIPTEYTYDDCPVTYSPAIGSPTATYLLVNANGDVLQLPLEGQVEWTARTDENKQAWYFVGKNTGENGLQILNAATHEALSIGGTDHFRIYATETAGEYSLHTDICGHENFSFRMQRSQLARNAQIYDIPCGSLSDNYISAVQYDETAINAYTGTRPSNWHTLYTKSLYAVKQGEELPITITVANELQEWETLTLHADWNRDGIFECSTPIMGTQQCSGILSIPADATLGKTRLRIRLTANGTNDAEQDVLGHVVDLLLLVMPSETHEGEENSIASTKKAEAFSIRYSDNQITVEADTEVTSVSLYRTDGCLVAQSNGNTLRHKGLEGIYVVRATTATIEIGQKVIIK